MAAGDAERVLIALAGVEPEMTRAVLAICVPLSAALALGQGALGVLPAMGGLLSTMADAGGPYLSRVRRVGSAAVFGSAPGLVIGSVTHGHGCSRWWRWSWWRA